MRSQESWFPVSVRTSVARGL
ncbi:hypothetical protein FRIGORI9N_420018 [Frigoribacterium sp. 9N]|nr:hypothetical protein FRIGORI9N_420018 [Frigoribacterium sp. 9N]